MKKVKIIATDFDGTLLTSDNKISDRTKKCLKELRDKSYIIIGVTARNLLSVKNVLDTSLFDCIILNNGSNVYYVKDDLLENVSSIERDVAKKIYDSFSNRSSQIDFCTPFRYLIRSNKKKEDSLLIKYIDGFDEVDDLISRMNVFFATDDEVDENRKLIEDEFEDINVVKMVDTDVANSRVWLTINPKSINKLSTLEKICKDLNHSIDEVVFFGDGENDLVLIENAGIGVAMGNALEIVKEKALFVTLSNDNDGIAEFLETNI